MLMYKILCFSPESTIPWIIGHQQLHYIMPPPPPPPPSLFLPPPSPLPPHEKEKIFATSITGVPYTPKKEKIIKNKTGNFQPKNHSIMISCFYLVMGRGEKKGGGGRGRKKKLNHDQELNQDLSTGGQRKFHNKNNKIPKKVTFRLCKVC